MKILEIFKSIQGEGFWLGRPAIFVRTAGCNLHCPFCDTKDSWNPSHGHEYTPEQVFHKVQLMNPGNFIKNVVITGGEPLMWKDQLQKLINLLSNSDYLVGIESNGTFSRPMNVNHFVVSPKKDAGYRYPSDTDELKYVVTQNFDDSVINEETRNAFAGRIWLQPDGYAMKEAWRQCYRLAMEDPRLRVGVQLHKLMEVQ